MKFFIMKFILIFGFHTLYFDSKAQLLHPDELSALLRQANNTAVTQSLKEKGYEYSNLPFTNALKETQESWYFNPLHISGEKPNALVIKITDSTQAIKMQYVLYNPYHYKQFIESLLKEKYRYEGVVVTGPFTGNVFRKDKTTFTISTFVATDGHPFYHIVIQ